ncbi:MAG: hypothetical protein ABI183_05395 [Polyangiaceae bacterium]
MRKILVVGAVTLSSMLVAGCFIITGGTDGYTSAPHPSASSDGAPATCAPDAECIALTCLGTSDCADAGQVCCLGSTGSGLSSSCQTKCVGPQFCKGDTDCPNGGSCTSQSCSGNGLSVVIQACGTVPDCTP